MQKLSKMAEESWSSQLWLQLWRKVILCLVSQNTILFVPFYLHPLNSFDFIVKSGKAVDGLKAEAKRRKTKEEKEFEAQEEEEKRNELDTLKKQMAEVQNTGHRMA